MCATSVSWPLYGDEYIIDFQPINVLQPIDQRSCMDKYGHCIIVIGTCATTGK